MEAFEGDGPVDHADGVEVVELLGERREPAHERAQRRATTVVEVASEHSRKALDERLRMRLAKGTRSGLSSLLTRRSSPARMMVRMERESRSALESRRSSEKTAGAISWASSMSRTGRNREV